MPETELTTEDFAGDTTNESPAETTEGVVEEAAETTPETPDETLTALEPVETKEMTPAELEKHRSGMHRAYTKGLEKLK